MEDSYELSSCLQKAIRRCDPIGLYCAMRLDKMKLDVWRKLEVMAVEDIGRACPTIVSYLRKRWEQYRKEKRISSKRFVLINTVNYMIYQNKSRMADNICHLYFEDLPDVEGDVKDGFKRALEEKDLDKTMKYAAHLYSQNKTAFMVELLRNPIDPEGNALRFYIDKWSKSTIQQGRTKLFLINLIQHRVMDLESIPKVKDIMEISMHEINKLYESNERRELPDWTFDKHTVKGKKMGRGIKHFFESSAILNQCYIDDPYEKEIVKKFTT